MRRSLQEIVELLVFGLIALLIGTGLLWLVGWVFDLVGGLFKFFAGLIWGLLRFIVPVAIAAAVVYLLVRVLQQRSRDSGTSGGTGPSDGGSPPGGTTTGGDAGSTASASPQTANNPTGSAATSSGPVAGAATANEPVSGEPGKPAHSDPAHSDPVHSDRAASQAARADAARSDAASEAARSDSVESTGMGDDLSGAGRVGPSDDIPYGDGAATSSSAPDPVSGRGEYSVDDEGTRFGETAAATDEPFDWNAPGEGSESSNYRSGAGEREGSEVWTPPQPSPPSDSEGDSPDSDHPFETPEVDRDGRNRFDENRFDENTGEGRFDESGDEDRNRNG